MARPYESPVTRRRMMARDSASPAPPDSSDQGGEGDEPPASPSSGNGDAGKDFTAFLPKEITAGKTFKAGEEIVLKIKAVDPDTGELEVEYAPAKEQYRAPDEGDSVAGIDSLEMPEE